MGHIPTKTLADNVANLAYVIGSNDMNVFYKYASGTATPYHVFGCVKQDGIYNGYSVEVGQLRDPRNSIQASEQRC